MNIYKLVPTDIDLVCTRSDGEIVRAHLLWMAFTCGSIRNILELFPDCKRFEVAATKDEVEKALPYIYEMMESDWMASENNIDHRLFRVFRALDVAPLMDVGMYHESLGTIITANFHDQWMSEQELSRFIEKFTTVIADHVDILDKNIDDMLLTGVLDSLRAHIASTSAKISTIHDHRHSLNIEMLGNLLTPFGVDFILSVIREVTTRSVGMRPSTLSGSDIVIQLLSIVIEMGATWDYVKARIYNILPLTGIAMFYMDYEDNICEPMRKAKEFVGEIDHEEALRHDLMNDLLWYYNITYGKFSKTDEQLYVEILVCNPLIVSGIFKPSTEPLYGHRVYLKAILSLSEEEKENLPRRRSID